MDSMCHARFAPFVLLLLLPIVQPAAAEGERRLVVDGEAVGIQEFPFTAALVICKDGASCVSSLPADATGVYETCQCQFFCSGSLVSAGAVLTAAHCMWDMDNRTHSYLDDHPFVVLGVTRVDSAKKSNFFGIRKAVHGGFVNHNQHMDNDIALLFLADCATGHSTVKIGTSEDFGGGKQCTDVTALGYGRRATYVDFFYNSSLSPPRLQATHDFVHAKEACSESISKAFKDHQSVLSFASLTNDAASAKTHDAAVRFFSNDRHICFGGASQSGVCHGDSGGPVVARNGNRWVQLGINSFGFNGCGVYADFGTRVAFYAEWLAQQLAAHDLQCGAKPADAFATWPVTPWPRSDADKGSRCFSSGTTWACAKSGECIDWAKRCDGVKDCADFSDEVVECPLIKFKQRCAEIDSALVKVLAPTNTSFWPLYDAVMGIEESAEYKNGLPPLQVQENIVYGKCKTWLEAVKASQHSLDSPTKSFTTSKEFDSLIEPCVDAGVLSRVLHNGTYMYAAKQAMRMLQNCAKQIIDNDIVDQRDQHIANFRSNIQKCSKPGPPPPGPAKNKPGSSSAARRLDGLLPTLVMLVFVVVRFN